MKKKRVSKVKPKTSTPSASKKKNQRSVSSRLAKSKKSAAEISKKATPRSSRVTNAIRKISQPKIIAPPQKVISVEPLSHAVPSVEPIHDLPFSYNETKLVLLVRDPFWAYSYWDFSSETWNWIGVFCEHDAQAKSKLRIHNLDQKSYYDIDVPLDAKNWYIELGLPNTNFQLELGLLDGQGNFHRIALSNSMKTPRNGPSENMDPDWELTSFELSEVYRLSKGSRSGLGSEALFSQRRAKL